jgi:hypothetical protein
MCWALILVLVYQLRTGPSGGRERTSPLPVANEPVRQWSPGDTLPDIPLLRVPLTSGEAATRLSLSEAVTGRCTILVFFQSSCEASRLMAQEWRGIHALVVDGDSLVVRWVSVPPDDPGALPFIVAFDLGDAFFSSLNAQDMNDLGVSPSPVVYVVETGPRLVRKPGLAPDALYGRAGGCRAWVEGQGSARGPPRGGV